MQPTLAYPGDGMTPYGSKSDQLMDELFIRKLMIKERLHEGRNPTWQRILAAFWYSEDSAHQNRPVDLLLSPTAAIKAK
jgi:hypothetical protein